MLYNGHGAESRTISLLLLLFWIFGAAIFGISGSMKNDIQRWAVTVQHRTIFFFLIKLRGRVYDNHVGYITLDNVCSVKPFWLGSQMSHFEFWIVETSSSVILLKFHENLRVDANDYYVKFRRSLLCSVITITLLTTIRQYAMQHNRITSSPD